MKINVTYLSGLLLCLCTFSQQPAALAQQPAVLEQQSAAPAQRSAAPAQRSTTLAQPSAVPSKQPNAAGQSSSMTSMTWLTTPDRSSLFTRQKDGLRFFPQASPAGGASLPVIDIEEDHSFQSIDGFGFALTQGSAMHIIRMSPASRAALLKELFTDDGDHIGVSYLRVSIGASDLNEHVFSYDDLPAGQTDTGLTHFDLGPDRNDVIPVLKEILAINPHIKILGSPWSAPTWMKSNHDTRGGSLLPQYYAAYAKYFVRYIQDMQAAGIPIDAITVQNEPLHPGNNPSMLMPAPDQALFVAQDLGPAFKAAGIQTRIIIYDHNCDRPDYPISILNNPEASQYIDGSAFHLYGGSIDALSTVHDAHPEKNLYFTEQMVVDHWRGDKNDGRLNIANPVSRLFIGATRNWSRNVLEWNLAADPEFKPFTDRGGCSMCEGAITIDHDSVHRNLAYYAMAHASKFVRPGAVRIASNIPDSLPNVAFRLASGQIVLIVANSAHGSRSFAIHSAGGTATASLPAGAVATYIWSLPGNAAAGFLHASGKYIVDGRDRKIILRGMGLGGWMLQEGYMLRLGSIGQQYKIKAKIADLIGPEKTKIFYDEWLAGHTRKVDIDSMASWGFNSVRLPMHYRLYTPAVEQEPIAGQNTWLEQGFALTDSLLAWCRANRIYLILDMHATPGGQGNDLNISDRDPSKPSVWESEANRQKLIALWKRLAARYANDPWIGGYDIINEPNWGFDDPADKRGTAGQRNEPLRKLMMDITAAIRSVDQHHMIIIEGNAFGNNYKGVLPPWDSNMTLSFHKYGNFNSEASIKQFLDLRDKYNIPLWLGESGENSNTWYTDAIRLVESQDIGWSWWPLKKMGNNNPLGIRISPGYQRLLDYWNDKGPRPSPAEADSALRQLLRDIRLENNSYHKDVIDAMFRQVRDRSTRPYAAHIVPDNKDTLLIPAIEYDLGAQGQAYYDMDTASYNFTPGVETVGNRGHQGRNDGVDIAKEGANDYYIFHIEEDEWLQYSIRVLRKGKYTVGLRLAASSDTGRVSLSFNDDFVAKKVPVPKTGGETQWQLLTFPNLSLKKGINTMRIYARKGGFTLKEITIVKK